MIAGALGGLVLVLALLAARKRQHGVLQVVAAAVLVALAIGLYMRGMHVAASALAIAGEAILLSAALRWSNVDLSRTAALTLAVIIFQALLGRWTGTWLLKPVGVMGHQHGVLQVVAAAVLVALAIGLYMRGMHVAASALAIAGEAILLSAALRWSNVDLSRTAALTLAVIIFQALLGMWTVTWLLKPIVVMGHLLGGLTTFALLLWMAWRATHSPIRLADALALRRWVMVVLALLAVQIALGGWTSANYAALACANDFPKCVGQWWPPHDFREGFVLWRGIGVDYEGGILDGASRIAIQMVHRMMAVVAFAALIALAVRLLRTPGLRGWAVLLALLACTQVALGIANVKLSLPLDVAVAHSAGAVLLLFVLVSLLARLRAVD